MSSILTIRRPDDMHLHLRQGVMMRRMSLISARQFARAVIMPNTDPPILTGEQAVEYSKAIRLAAPGLFPLMTIQITESTTPETVLRARELGVVAGKVYPRGMTTNSENGVLDYGVLGPVLSAMQRCGMLLLLHGEHPGSEYCLDRERDFVSEILWNIAREFPHLKIVLEHITDADSVEAVLEHPNVAATITAHHLVLSLNDVIGGKLMPHHFCKPVAKRPKDRDVLLWAATSGNPKFFFGSDSAPHLRENKECAEGCAGILTAHVAMPLLARLFEALGKFDLLGGFTSSFGAQFYGLPLNTGRLTFYREELIVPYECHGVVPFMAGQKLPLRVA